MVKPLLIEPNGVYDDSALYCSVGLTMNALAVGRRSGALRFSRQGRRTIYLGRWVLDWLEAPACGPAAAPPPPAPRAEGQEAARGWPRRPHPPAAGRAGRAGRPGRRLRAARRAARPGRLSRSRVKTNTVADSQPFRPRAPLARPRTSGKKRTARVVKTRAVRNS
jgi:hypothetical protein